jgi:hypothetical protein
MKVVPDAAVWADAPVEQAALQELMGGLVNRLLPGFLTEQRVRDLSVRKTRRPTEQVKDSLFQRGHNAARDVAERLGDEPRRLVGVGSIALFGPHVSEQPIASPWELPA